MWWERGNPLKKYVINGDEIIYQYDAQGRLNSKSVNNVVKDKFYYDGDKLIAIEKDNNKYRLIYDIEGLAGYELNGNSGANTVYFNKDAQGNVISLIDNNGYTGFRYLYTSSGKLIGTYDYQINAEGTFALANENPFRWKSQYYDADTGLYLIDGRWYDPERGRFINAASPERLLSTASVIFALNLYALWTRNPLAVIIAAQTVLPSLDFYWDGTIPPANGEELTWWDIWGKYVVYGVIGVAATVVACIYSGPCGGATVATVFVTLGKIALGTAIGAAVLLIIGGILSGICAALVGGEFWTAFANHVQDNLLDALVTSFAFSAVAVAVGNIIQYAQCFKEGTPVVTIPVNLLNFFINIFLHKTNNLSIPKHSVFFAILLSHGFLLRRATDLLRLHGEICRQISPRGRFFVAFF